MNLIRWVVFLEMTRLLWPAMAAPAGTNKETKEPAPPPATQTTNAFAAFQIQKGFRLELAAEAPQVTAPVALACDERGRLFVAEMRDSADRGGPASPSGRIRLLEDTDGDGVFDASTVYAEDLRRPSALACYEGGLFVAAAPDIFYLKDTKGSGKADMRKVVFTGFGSSNALDSAALPNGFNWGLDNRIHGAAAGLGGLVTALGTPNAPPVALGRHDFAFDPRTLTLSPEAGSAQSGLSFDSRGRKFISDFTRPLQLPMYDLRYIARNPFFPKPPEAIDVASPTTAIFRFVPVGDTSPLATQGPVRTAAPETTMLAPGWLTLARGGVIYRGGLFPSNYFDNVFIADPGAHLIHRLVLREHGLEPVAERAPEDKSTEFLVSRDDSFRPMQIINGPDGALYVADAQSGEEGGRIYRIVPENFKRPGSPALDKATTYELVAALADANGWRRDTAARLLYQRQDPRAAALLADMVSNARLPLARLQALHALDGLGALQEGSVLKALGDADERVRQHAVRLSEALVRNGVISDALWDRLRPLAADPSVRVRYQLAFTLGEIRRPDRDQVLAGILGRDLDNRWVRAAALSSLGDGAAQQFIRLASIGPFRNSAAGDRFLQELATMIGVKGELGEVTQLLEAIVRTPPVPQQAFAWLAALGEGLHRTRSSLALVDPQGRLQGLYLQAVTAATDETAAVPQRAEALRMLGTNPYSFVDFADVLFAALNPTRPLAMQSAAIAAVGHFNDPRVAANLMQCWPGLTPALRREAVTALLRRRERLPAVLTALEKGPIRRADLSSAQVDFLRTYPDPAISRRAVQLFGPVPLQRPELRQRFLPALRLVGVGDHGRQIFLARCAACHQLGGEGQALGPDLAGARIQGKEKLLTAILEPNLELRPGYLTYVVETEDGESLVGLLRDDNPTTLTLGQPNGLAIVLPRTNLRSLQTESWSLMPEDVTEGFGPQDLADLLAYLMTAPNQGGR